MQRELTCIVCPMGCSLKVEFEDNKVISVSGNTCKRGEEYANNECTNPVRTVTSTIKCENGELVAVKTDKPIPKDKISDCMKIINTTVATLPICIGDIIVGDVFGSNIVATSSKNK